MNGTTIHGVTDITAHRHDYQDAPLKLTIKTEYSEYASEVTLFFKDGEAELVERLVAAINYAVRAPQVQGAAE